MWIPVVVPPVTFMLLLFPDGHLPSPRWKWFARILGASMVIVYLTILLAPGKFGDEAGAFADYRNPLGVEALRPVLSVAIASIAMLPIGVIGSLWALVRRFRRSTGIERLQLRLLVTTASFVAILYTIALLISFAGSWGVNQPTWMTILQSVSVFSFGLIPIAIGVRAALPPLRYRRRDQSRAVVRNDRRRHHRGVRRDRGRDRHARRQQGRADLRPPRRRSSRSPSNRCGPGAQRFADRAGLR
jgi:hypothetical protein